MEAVAWEVINTRRFAASFGKLIRAPDPDGNLAPVVDDGPKLSAINTLVKIAERRAKFRGLDAPQRRAVDVITGDMVSHCRGPRTAGRRLAARSWRGDAAAIVTGSTDGQSGYGLSHNAQVGHPEP